MKGTVLLFLLFASGLAFAQEEHVREMKAFWSQYEEAYLAKDFQKVTTLSHPLVVEKSGGAIYFINDLLYDAGMFESAGLQVVALTAKQPSQIIEAGDELLAMLPYERVFVSDGEQIIEKHFALAASQDKGKNWNFFDLSKQDEESIKIYLPHYDDRLSVYLK